MTLPSDPLTKSDLRARILALRALAGAATGAKAADQLCRLILESGLVPDSAVVAGYWPMRGEINLLPVLDALAGRGCCTALPVVDKLRQPLVFRQWAVGDALENGRYDTCHPLKTAPVVTPDAVLVPLLAFDRRGFRLGYGGGFYDQTLERLRADGQVIAVGVAFSAQEVAEVPIEEHDQPMDAIVTETEIIRIARS